MGPSSIGCRSILVLSVVLFLATVSCRHQPGMEAGGQDDLVVVARWPDGFPAVGIRLGLHSVNAAGGDALIDRGETDAMGRVVLDAGGGGGRAEIRAEGMADPWKAGVTIPCSSSFDVTLPPPEEIVVLVAIDERVAADQIEIDGYLEHSGSLRFQQTVPGRFVLRTLLREPIKIYVSPASDAVVLLPRSAMNFVSEGIVSVTPPAELHFDALPNPHPSRASDASAAETGVCGTEPARVLSVVDDSGSPVAGAQVFDMAEKLLGTTDGKGQVHLPRSTVPIGWIQAEGHRMTLVVPDLSTRAPVEPICLTRTARVEVVIGLGFDRDSALCLRSAWGDPTPLTDGRPANRHRSDRDKGVAATRRERDVWIFDQVIAGLGFVVGFQDGMTFFDDPHPALAPGETRRIVLGGSSARALIGRVLDDHARPVPFAGVKLWPEGGRTSPIFRRARADGSFHFGPFRPGPLTILEVDAEGYAVNGRHGEAAVSRNPIRLVTLRTVRVSALAPDGSPLQEFRVSPFRPDLFEFQPWQWCGTCNYFMQQCKASATDHADAEVQVLRGHRGGVTVETDGGSTFVILDPGASEVAVRLRPQVQVFNRFKGIPPLFAGGIFMRIAVSPRPSEIGFTQYAIIADEPPRAILEHLALDPGHYVFELGEQRSDGVEVIHDTKTVDLTLPTPGSAPAEFDLEWIW